MVGLAWIGAAAGCSEAVAPLPEIGPPPQAGAVRAWPDDPPRGPFPSAFELVLNREDLNREGWDKGGRICRLRVFAAAEKGGAQLSCTPIRSADLSVPRDYEELPSQEVAQLAALAERSQLYEGGHIGSIGSFGPVETLRLSPLGGGRTVVLVVSGNKNFDEDSYRRRLLKLLREIEERLVQKAHRAKRPL